MREDIERERAAARAVNEERTRLTLATQAAGVGIWDLDQVTGAVTSSPRLREIFGIPLDREMTRDDIRRRIYPDDWRVVAEISARALDPAILAQQHYEYPLLHPDGTVRWGAGQRLGGLRGRPPRGRTRRATWAAPRTSPSGALEQAWRDMA